jgi:protoporphyrinogen/coproporphyrinogen III oxidase
MTNAHVVVVGGGIAGLATAFRIERALERHRVPGRVTVMEAGPRVGGNIRSEVADGFTFEWGPNGFLDNVPSSLELAHDLGLDDELQKADPRAAIRYLWRNGRLHTLPTGPVSFFKSPVLSLRGRLRLLLEPFQAQGPVDEDESVRMFGVRRIGREATDVLIDAMVSGVFAGDAATLSLPSAFPKMRAMEAEYGSLVRAMIARRKTRSGGGPSGPGGTLTSFRAGMETLPRALCERLARRVKVDAPVQGLRRDSDTGHWTVIMRGGDEVPADHVVLAIPAPAAATVTESVGPDLAAVLRSMPTAGLAVVALGYRETDLSEAPDGFGFLVPRSEKLRMLGCLRDSTIFPGRAPDGYALLRVMIGGAHDPEAVRLSDDELLAVVRSELITTLGVTAEPTGTRVFRHPLGIGQYTLGHQDRISAVQEILQALPGLTVTGSSYLGVSMNSCIEDAALHAETVVDRLARAGSAAAATPDPQPQRIV